MRDKDGVNAAYLICEMFSYYRAKGIGLVEKLDEIYRKYGYCLNTLHSYEFEGAAGMTRMQGVMDRFRCGIESVGPERVLNILDYSKGLAGLPKSDVLRYLLEDDCSLVIRPSGTEPKLKAYISVCAESKEEAEKIETRIAEHLEHYIS